MLETVNLPLLAYVSVFGLAALLCLLCLPRARQLEDVDTREGLVALLVTSAGWAAAQAAFLAAPSLELKYVFYQSGLIVGLSTIGPWLYFCSAYTGRSLHRNPRIRRAAVAVFLAIVLLKMTNPVHGLYFTPVVEEAPFTHLRIEYHAVHWLVTGFVYSLAAVGYFMLFELFLTAGYDTGPLSLLVGLTALPVVFDVVGYTSPLLIDITYEPIGVALFAAGLLFVFAARFQAVQFAADVDNPVIYLDDERRVRDYNRMALDLFPALGDGVGDRLEAVVPAVTDVLEDVDAVVELDGDPGRRYFRPSANDFTLGGSRVGRLLVLTDVTEAETHRRELRRQNDRLERFAGVVSHDLRNPLNVATGRLDMARRDRDSEDLSAVSTALDRMATIIDDVLALARQGQSIDDTETVALSWVVDRCRESVDLRGATLTLEGNHRFAADPERVRQLFENLVRNSLEHGPGDGDPASLTVRVGPLASGEGFYVEDDGRGIPENEREQVFESGYTTSADGTGFGLAIVGEIAEAHGWTVAVGESERGGARFEFAGAT